jgi:hypothetical protein
MEAGPCQGPQAMGSTGVWQRAGRGAARMGWAEVLVSGADGHAIGDLVLRPTPRPDGSAAWAVFQAGEEGSTFPAVQARGYPIQERSREA